MAKITEAEFARLCRGIHEDRESIWKHNPIGTRDETLLWMLLSVLSSYLSLSEMETPCFTGMPNAATYRTAIESVVREKAAERFDTRAYLDELLAFADDVTIELPADIDNDRAIFSYGSLLDHKILKNLLRERSEFYIFETRDVAEAARLASENPGHIVILKNVLMEGVRVTIVTEAILRRWYAERGGDISKLVDAGVTSMEEPRYAYLYARPARDGERGRSLNGGIICNLTEAEIAMLDLYEMEPVLKRERVPQIQIQGKIYTPNHVAFYAGQESPETITEAERDERALILAAGRKPGRQGPNAKWPMDVRRSW
jgi:hypothetical protein